MLTRVVLFVSVLLLLIAKTTTAATYYATPSGGQAGCSTNTNSPQTGLLNGISCLSSGDTLILKNGVYATKINDTIPSNTTIRAENTRQAILRPGGVDQIITMIGKSNITIDGLVLDCNNQATGQIVSFYSNGPGNVFQNGEIGNCVGKHDPNGTWAVGGTGSNPYTFRNNYVHDFGNNDPPGDCSSCYSYGMYISTNDNLVEGNTFQNISGYGIQVYGGGSAISGVVIRNNTFINTNSVLLGGVGGSGGTGTKMYGNVLVNIGHTNMGFDGHGVLAQRNVNLVYNNTIVGARLNCIYLSGDNGAAQNNICYQNGNDNVGTNGVNNSIGNNLLSTNPQFVNTGAGDYHISSTSPARGGGVVLNSVFTTDKDGVTWGTDSSSTGWGRGAYKFNAGPPPVSFPSQLQLTFEEGVGSLANDVRNNGGFGTLTGSVLPAWVSGRLGKFGLHFNGQGDSVTLSTGGLNTNFTIAFSFNADGTIVNTKTTHIFKELFSNNNEVSFSWDHTGAAYQQAFVIGTGSSLVTYNACKYVTSLTNSTWYRVALTFNGSQMRCYLNGVLDNLATSDAPIGTLSSAVLGFGNNSYWQGFLDEFIIDNKVYTQDEINSDFNRNFNPLPVSPALRDRNIVR